MKRVRSGSLFYAGFPPEPPIPVRKPSPMRAQRQQEAPYTAPHTAPPTGVRPVDAASTIPLRQHSAGDLQEPGNIGAGYVVRFAVRVHGGRFGSF